MPADCRGARLDQALAGLLPSQSRASLQRLLRGGLVQVENGAARASYRVRGGERVKVTLPPPVSTGLEAEDIPLEVLHEDSDLILLNKPPGLTVHPGAGRRTGTLVNALLHHCAHLSGIGGVERPGIVHRLDRDTSGVILVAKNDLAHRSLSAQFKDRTIEKTYQALVWGRPRTPAGLIDAPIGRHPTARVRMAIRPDGRNARTAWQVTETLGAVTLLTLAPETGRTHQIRVHLAAQGHPIIGDRLYGGTSRRGAPSEVDAAIAAFGGLALHALSLAFNHPRSGERLAFTARLPAPWETLLEELRRLGARPGRSGGGRP